MPITIELLDKNRALLQGHALMGIVSVEALRALASDEFRADARRILTEVDSMAKQREASCERASERLRRAQTMLEDELPTLRSLRCGASL